ncbi:hypothetical protein E8E12_011502 [Didymella heteroderae]|uniref:Sodium/calcium exchanger membrane region domain-containing protein n=1 Tax=Didymella heteroderae TaxID=1769908 RepID=A0A9P5C6F6_9PLEO|nr:hypothetical protein E8E12_011502 [Didymella heteroderae]
MVDIDALAYNIAVFITSLFLLESGADKFIDHTTIVAHRTGTSETVVSLLTAGAEWEELIVVIAALAHNRASLAIGNIVGSAISNILGAFSLGLLFHNRGEAVRFDRSARVYSLVLLAVTTLTTPILYFPTTSFSLAYGALLLASFAVYIASVGWAISRGRLAAPEDSDSDTDESSSSTNSFDRSDRDVENDFGRAASASSTTPLLSHQHRSKHRSLPSHVFHLILGFLAICLSGYVLSHSASGIVDLLAISDVLFGVVVLSIATTLPEKFIAVMSGRRGNAGVLVANTAGSNIFLLTLCAGIVLLDTKGKFPRGSVSAIELGVLWGSTVAFAATVWLGGRFAAWIGGVMVLAYVAFVVLEFTVARE